MYCDSRWALSGVILLVLFAAGCGRATQEILPGADPRHGATLLAAHGCGACHQIPGVVGADGTLGPPLTAYGRRVYIVGRLANRPDHLLRWIQDPPGVKPDTAMPTLPLSEAEARDMAAYLYTLR